MSFERTDEIDDGPDAPGWWVWVMLALVLAAAAWLTFL